MPVYVLNSCVNMHMVVGQFGIGRH